MERTYPHAYPIRPADVEFIRRRYNATGELVRRLEAGSAGNPPWRLERQRGVLEGMETFALALGYWGGVDELISGNGERKPRH